MPPMPGGSNAYARAERDAMEAHAAARTRVAARVAEREGRRPSRAAPASAASAAASAASSDGSIAELIVVAQAPIPAQMPFYYFEVTLLAACDGGAIAVGLYPDDGLPASDSGAQSRSGAPTPIAGWCPGSAVYAQSGSAVRFAPPSEAATNAAEALRTPVPTHNYAEPYAQGDVIGVLWDAESREVRFTRNGVACEIAFTMGAADGDGGRRLYRPAVALGRMRTGPHADRVRLNLGQRAFRYTALDKTRPLLDIAAAQQAAETAAARARRAKLEEQQARAEEELAARLAARVAAAEDLVSMMGGSMTTAVAVKLLEQCGDDSGVAANTIWTRPDELERIKLLVDEEERAKAAAAAAGAAAAALSARATEGGASGAAGCAGGAAGSEEEGASAQRGAAAAEESRAAAYDPRASARVELGSAFDYSEEDESSSTAVRVTGAKGSAGEFILFTVTFCANPPDNLTCSPLLYFN